MMQVLADYLTELRIDADIMVATNILVIIKWTYSFSCSVDQQYATSTELTVCVNWYDFHSFHYIPKSHLHNLRL
jgi:acyl-CoA thioesterase FadM